MSTIKTCGPVDERSLKQLERCMEAGDAAFGVLCADHHPGYSQPIGGGIAYEGYVSPSGVGYDIGCIARGARVSAIDGYAIPIESVTHDDPISCLPGGRLRRVAPHNGSIARGTKGVHRLGLANGRSLHVTPDHRLMTPHGWVEAANLELGDLVLCHPFVGLRREPFAIEPALIRLVAYVSGDGHLTTGGKRVPVYTTVDQDAHALG